MYITIMSTKRHDEDASTWTTVVWTTLLTIIGFGFALLRYMQFYHSFDAGSFNRLSRVELFIYRATGQWGLIAIMLLMGFVGLFNAIIAFREVRRR
ncbi:hypothetical protein SIO70_12420 [Chitinophaga sancti]|uniref:hypothetical protein n=1 Tax=Chitinophaga sancti TaxID=1004 RepID=UPI002A7583FC|nr:hypothetical protein [Chitinophaga sancti]WPQ65655.1 hypothetical protein SIO70_12420 [Chitinophaga sancti]